MNPERLRRDILGALMQHPAYTADVPDLRATLARNGRDAATDAIRQALAWLTEAQLIFVGTRGNGQPVATLKEDGRDCWLDLRQVPGVGRPELDGRVVATSAAAAIDILKGN